MSVLRVQYGFLAALLGATALVAVPAVADVKAGVDAWGRGEYTKAVEEWRPAAVAGDADAQFDLGQAYRLGHGVPVDPVMAEQWYGRAATQGHVQAEDNYGLILFQNGKREQALPWLEKSAARGEPRAQLVLGTMLFNGDVVQKDWVRAYALMVRSSASGLPQGTQTLAQMDRYIPADVRQQGVTLAHQYEASLAQTATPPERAPGEKPPVATAAASQPVKPASTKPQLPRQVAATRPAPPPAPTKPAPTPVASAKGWRFQVGAFRDEANAHGLWQQLHTRVGAVGGLQPYYVVTGGLTRLQIGSLASRADVERVCGELKAHAPGTPCVAIAP